MPRDVATRWNLTFTLLVYALDYWEAVDKFTADKENKMRKCELDNREWRMVEELAKVLKVRAPANCLLIIASDP